MKKSALLTTLILLVMFASSCNSTTKETTTQPIFTEGCCINEWTKVGEDADGDITYYLGYETIQKGDEYV